MRKSLAWRREQSGWPRRSTRVQLCGPRQAGMLATQIATLDCLAGCLWTWCRQFCGSGPPAEASIPVDGCIWTWVWMHPSSDNAAARRSAEKVRGRICRKSRVLLPPPPPPPAIPLPKRQRRLLLACLEGRGLTNILGAVMCVSEELLCSFELLKPLDASALKQHMKKGDSKKQ